MSNGVIFIVFLSIFIIFGNCEDAHNWSQFLAKIKHWQTLIYSQVASVKPETMKLPRLSSLDCHNMYIVTGKPVICIGNAETYYFIGSN